MFLPWTGKVPGLPAPLLPLLPWGVCGIGKYCQSTGSERISQRPLDWEEEGYGGPFITEAASQAQGGGGGRQPHPLTTINCASAYNLAVSEPTQAHVRWVFALENFLPKIL